MYHLYYGGCKLRVEALSVIKSHSRSKECEHSKEQNNCLLRLINVIKQPDCWQVENLPCMQNSYLFVIKYFKKRAFTSQSKQEFQKPTWNKGKIKDDK
uniref:Uncharacterized protein n=1 Tax=Arundo donax TaxID=35708 RepID=A0A0A8YZC9_ARUDO